MRLIPSIKALVLDDDKVLILKAWNGKFDIPGGRVKKHEREPTETLLREIAEETDINVDIVRHVADTTITANEEREIIARVYLCNYKGGDVTLSREHTDYVWKPLSEIGEEYPSWIREAVKSV